MHASHYVPPVLAVLVAMSALAAGPAHAASIDIFGGIGGRSLGYTPIIPEVIDPASPTSSLYVSRSRSWTTDRTASSVSVEATGSLGALKLAIRGEAFCAMDCDVEYVEAYATLRVRDVVAFEGATEGFVRQRTRVHGTNIFTSGTFDDPSDHYISAEFAAFWAPGGVYANEPAFSFSAFRGGDGETIDGRWDGGDGETIDGRWDGGDGETIDGRGIIDVGIGAPAISAIAAGATARQVTETPVLWANVVYYLTVSGTCAIRSGNSCAFSGDFSNTALLGQFEFINPDGTVNRDVRITSESGFDYTQRIAGDFSWFDGGDGGPTPVPEPSTTALLGTAWAVALGARRTRRRAR